MNINDTVCLLESLGFNQTLLIIQDNSGHGCQRKLARSLIVLPRINIVNTKKDTMVLITETIWFHNYIHSLLSFALFLLYFCM